MSAPGQSSIRDASTPFPPSKGRRQQCQGLGGGALTVEGGGADIAGVELKDNQGPDSISFLPYLRNQEILVRNHMVAHGTRADAYYEGNWKLILGPGSGSSGGHYTEPKSEDAWKKAIQEFGRKPKNHGELEHPSFIQLYELIADPGEQRNLAGAHFQRAKNMISAYRKVVANGRSTRGSKLLNGREIKIFRPPGFVWKK